MNGVLHTPELCDVTYSLHITMVNYHLCTVCILILQQKHLKHAIEKFLQGKINK